MERRKITWFKSSQAKMENSQMLVYDPFKLSLMNVLTCKLVFVFLIDCRSVTTSGHDVIEFDFAFRLGLNK